MKTGESGTKQKRVRLPQGGLAVRPIYKLLQVMSNPCEPCARNSNQVSFRSMSAKEIQHALAKLPVKERGSLAAWLLETLPPHGTEDGAAEGIEEAARRREEIDSGRVQP